MKKCPYCAEEIQDAAIVCKHCGRDLNPPPAAPTKPQQQRRPTARRLLIGAIGCAAVGAVTVLVLTFLPLLLVLTDDGPRMAAPPEPTLNVSAGRRSDGLVITNRENAPLSGCRVTVRDGAITWTAYIVRAIQPAGSERVSWPDFRSNNNQVMPAYIGQSRDSFTIECQYGQSATLSF